MTNPTYCGNYPTADHSDCASSIECQHATLPAQAPLAPGNGDDLGSRITDALRADRESGYARSAYIHTNGDEQRERELQRKSAELQEQANVQIVGMWRAFYDYAGAVGQLRSQLEDMLRSWGQVDADDVSADELARFEQLQLIVRDTFGIEL